MRTLHAAVLISLVLSAPGFAQIPESVPRAMSGRNGTHEASGRWDWIG